jgi:hypothetical protein
VRAPLFNRCSLLARAIMLSQGSVPVLAEETCLVADALSARHMVVCLQHAALCREAFARLPHSQVGADAAWFGCLFLLLYNSHCVCVCQGCRESQHAQTAAVPG